MPLVDQKRKRPEARARSTREKALPKRSRFIVCSLLVCFGKLPRGFFEDIAVSVLKIDPGKKLRVLRRSPPGGLR